MSIYTQNTEKEILCKGVVGGQVFVLLGVRLQCDAQTVFLCDSCRLCNRSRGQHGVCVDVRLKPDCWFRSVFSSPALLTVRDHMTVRVC